MKFIQIFLALILTQFAGQFFACDASTVRSRSDSARSKRVHSDRSLNTDDLIQSANQLLKKNRLLVDRQSQYVPTHNGQSPNHGKSPEGPVVYPLPREHIAQIEGEIQNPVAIELKDRATELLYHTLQLFKNGKELSKEQRDLLQLQQHLDKQAKLVALALNATPQGSQFEERRRELQKLMSTYYARSIVVGLNYSLCEQNETSRL